MNPYSRGYQLLQKSKEKQACREIDNRNPLPRLHILDPTATDNCDYREPVTQEREHREDSPKTYTNLLQAVSCSPDHSVLIDGDPTSESNWNLNAL